MARNRTIRLGTAAVATIAVFACYTRGISGPPVIMIENASHADLTEVQVTHLPAVKNFDRIPPGGQVEFVETRMRGEAGGAISFRAGGETHQAEGLGYIESIGGYCRRIRIDEKFQIQTRDDLGCFRFRRLFRAS